jgi:hypothetical protein
VGLSGIMMVFYRAVLTRLSTFLARLPLLAVDFKSAGETLSSLRPRTLSLSLSPTQYKTTMASHSDSVSDVLLHPDALYCLKRKQLENLCTRLDLKATGKVSEACMKHALRGRS